LKNKLINHGTFTILFLGSFLHLQAQNDSLKNKKIYSFGLFGSGGFSTDGGRIAKTYLNQMKAGTRFDDFKLKSISQQSSRNDLTFGFALGWKVKKWKNRIFSFLEIGTGLAYSMGEGGSGRAIRTQNKTYNYLDSFQTTNSSIHGVKWISKIAVHTKPFLKGFAIWAGMDMSYMYAKIGNSNQDPYLSYENHSWLNPEKLELYSSKASFFF